MRNPDNRERRVTVGRNIKTSLHSVGAMALLGCSAAALADGDSAVQLRGVEVTGNHDTAAYQAPSKAPLDAIQPTSVISQQYIQNNVAPGANYDEIIKISPSVFAVAPNGPGLQENSYLSIRGFQDGQYNVTLDGIPWGDSNDFTHHTTSYFMAHDLGDLAVDRGPGTAETIGNATFGGTVQLSTKAPAAETQVNPYLSGGSFNTLQGGLEYDTGTLQKYGKASAFIDGERVTSDGYLTNNGQTRDNMMAKLVRPVGDNTVITAVAMYNSVHQNVGLGATQAQINQYGPNYMLSADPTQQNSSDYNLDDIHTDFEYLGIKTRFGDGWSLDNKVYTYAYYHVGKNGEDPNGDTPNGTEIPGGGCVVGPNDPSNKCNNDVPGERLTNNYRSFGDILRVSKGYSFGEIKAGFWIDNQTNLRELDEVDYTLGGVTYNISPVESPNGPIDRLQHNQLVTVQPYVQIDWKPLQDLTVSPGVKYNYFRRRTDALVNQKTQLPADVAKNYEQLLPSLAVHYAIRQNWTAYAQVAEGYLAPNLNLFYVKNPLAADAGLSPERTWNYQVGTSWQSAGLVLSGDLYWINFNNLIQKASTGLFVNTGGADYKGAEAEATYYLGQGLTVFGNGSFNSAKNSADGSFVAEVPEETLAGGLIYSRSGIYGSLIDKWVGRRFDSVYGTNDQEFQPYSDLMLSAGYTMKNVFDANSVSLKVSVDNLLDVNKISSLAGTTVGLGPTSTQSQPDAGTPLYWTVAGRSVIATLSVTF
jgi:iron complex outermembrane receptor protein